MKRINLFFIALILCIHRQGVSDERYITWQEIENENLRRVHFIQSLFESAMNQTATQDACIVILGSHSYGISMPDSDIDFALLVPDESSADLFLPLLEEFYTVCFENNIFWDKNGWHPPVSRMNYEVDSEKLFTSPLKLAKIRASDDKTTLRYALYNPEYGGGSFQLYQSFKEAFSVFSFSPRLVVAEERAKTKRAVESTRRQTKFLKGALRNVSNDYSIRNINIEVKTRWIKPMVELLQYLCMSNGLLPRNVEESIDLLVERRTLTPVLASAISNFLLFTIELRNRLGKNFQSDYLKRDEIQTLVDGYDVLDKLSHIQK